MRKFQCLLFALKQSYICRYIIFMTVPLKLSSVIVICWLIQESLCLKPDWLEEKRLLSKERFFV